VTVRVYDLNPPAFRDDLEFHQGSVLDRDSIASALTNVDAVLHLAAVADVKDVLADPPYAETVNVRGTLNVIEAMRNAGTPRLVYGSTTWVYAGAAGSTIDEDTPVPQPAHIYTATKIAGEVYCSAYAHLFGLQTTILRYGIPYGPRARSGGVVALFVERALSGQPLTLAGDGQQFRQFIYVEDLAEGNVAALAPSAIGRTYNLDGAERVTIRQIADTVERLVGAVGRRFIDARPGDFEGKQVSSRRAHAELGWEPRTTFDEGMRRYVAWVTSQKTPRAITTTIS
jgi:UDP-glucose 4-epimerase